MFGGILNLFIVVCWVNTNFPIILQNKIGQMNITASDSKTNPVCTGSEDYQRFVPSSFHIAGKMFIFNLITKYYQEKKPLIRGEGLPIYYNFGRSMTVSDFFVFQFGTFKLEL